MLAQKLERWISDEGQSTGVNVAGGLMGCLRFSVSRSITFKASSWDLNSATRLSRCLICLWSDCTTSESTQQPGGL
jgi:hypothetical protein